ncbi:MAG: hypothetical protein LBB88_04640 [Planctomycetaceae bacterium]|nr:hypothetical protein [Planctomycetaceae bacterium]
MTQYHNQQNLQHVENKKDVGRLNSVLAHNNFKRRIMNLFDCQLLRLQCLRRLIPASNSTTTIQLQLIQLKK